MKFGTKAATPAASTSGTQEGRSHGRPPKAKLSEETKGPAQKTDIHSALSKIQALNKKYSHEDNETEEEDLLGQPAPRSGEVGEVGQHLPILSGRPSFLCAICNLTFNNKDDFREDDGWVFCPLCEVLSHVVCLHAKKCICGFKPNCKHHAYNMTLRIF